MSNIYAYDENSIVTEKLDAVPTDGQNYGITNDTFDLEYHYYTVSSVDAQHNITHYMQHDKPVMELIKKLKDTTAQIDALTQMVIST